MSSLKPGLVRVTVEGNDRDGLLDNSGQFVRLDHGVFVFTTRSANLTDARPLIVLDTNPISAQAIAWILRTNGYAGIADQIEAQTKSPKPEEPQGIGATVLASQVGECDGSERTWVRFRLSRTECWIDSLGHIRDWSDLEGVTS